MEAFAFNFGVYLPFVGVPCQLAGEHEVVVKMSSSLWSIWEGHGGTH